MLLPYLIGNDVVCTGAIGIVPHWTQTRLFTSLHRDPRVKVVDVRRSVIAVARDILSCSIILSTSLHGLIVAEAYGIPALLVYLRQPPNGDPLKFDDYFAATQRESVPAVVSEPSQILKLVDAAARQERSRWDQAESLWRAFPASKNSQQLPDKPRVSWNVLHNGI